MGLFGNRNSESRETSSFEEVLGEFDKIRAERGDSPLSETPTFRKWLRDENGNYHSENECNLKVNPLKREAQIPKTTTEKKYSCKGCGLHFADYFLGND